MNYGSNREPNFYPGFDITSLISRWGNFNLDILYLGYFREVPAEYNFTDIDIQKFHKEFSKHFHNSILGYHFKKSSANKAWKNEYTYVLENEIIVNKDSSEVTVYFQRENCPFLKEIFSFIKSRKKGKENKAHINLIISEQHGLDNKKIDFPKPEIDLSKIYNDDFENFHHKILDILKQKDKSGLHLLYGPPGTGKSTYIRYLCGLVKKQIIFLPGKMARNLDDLAMLKYLMNNENSILVIEDAEELIATRAGQRSSNLAMILNITDGILGESLGIQIIATFNTDIKNIDPALRRKGRLQSAYEFKPLAAEKATALLQEQNCKHTASGEMTLAEIYNITEDEQYKEQERKAVGFR